MDDDDYDEDQYQRNENRRHRGGRGRGNNNRNRDFQREKGRSNRGNRGKKYNYKQNGVYNKNNNFDRSGNNYNNDNLSYSKNQIKNDYFLNNDNNNIENENIKENNNNQKAEKKLFFYPNKIKELEKKDIIDVITELNSDDNLCKKINGTIFQKDTCYSFMNTIKKISEDNSEPVIILIYKIIENTNFINQTAINFIKNQDYDDINYLNFFENFLIFLQKYLLISSKKFDININLTENKKLLESLILKEDIEQNKKQSMQRVIQEINNYEEKNFELSKYEYEKKKKEKEENSKNQQKNKINYKEIKTIINIDDFFNEVNYNIDSNLPKGKFDSYESYINTMFFLEYEDCYRNLRRAIYKLKNKYVNIHNLNKNEKKNFERNQKDIYCYFNGEMINIEINNEGIFIIIDFSSLTGKKINFSKRMINGSLVIITNNSFSDYLFTIVSYNPYIEKKLIEKNGDNGRKYKLDMFKIPKEPKYRIKLEVINLSNEAFAFMLANKNNLQIFESKSYFQTYIHILNRLQNLVIKQLPFENEIVKVNFDNLEIDNPNNIFIYNDNLINPKENIFPDSLKNNLDESQLEAVKHCLTYKLALIQGPPGTGKTHIGTIVTNIFKQNLKKDSKILVVCFTNHALDQFLENILKYNVDEKDIVRIGGRCKNENIKKLVLNSTEKYKNWKFREIENKIRLLGKEMEDMIKLVQNTKESIIEEYILKYMKK